MLKPAVCPQGTVKRTLFSHPVTLDQPDGFHIYPEWSTLEVTLLTILSKHHRKVLTRETIADVISYTSSAYSTGRRL
ncbi:hypothetical protein MAR_021114 [Mya arenaria]|uniref:Uncharacterized protein n=1 Tax=Mya arenaria TaxID=6604 RepID=A0ABY7E7A3_MYAAR|nr:hypothetical protein MAR_021114 [Mya arenaria]